MTYKSKSYAEPSKPVGRVAELFAGVGGFRIGLSRAGWSTVYSNQWEPSTKLQHASDVYVAQFGQEGHSNQDIATVESIPVDFDLLVGGFPCQDYSVAKSLSSAIGLEGKKGVLWWEILRLVNRHKPKYVFLENVDRLLKSPSTQRGRDFAVMLSTLGAEGYSVEWRVVNAADYGFPQRRIRVFIVASRTDFPQTPVKPDDVIADKGILARALPISKSLPGIEEISLEDSPEVISQTFNRGGGKSPFRNAGFFTDGIAYTTTVEADWLGEKHLLGDVLLPEEVVPETFWVDEARISEWAYLKGAKSIERVHKVTGFAYKYSEGKMAFPDALDKPSRTILTGEGGATPSRFKHIIQTERGFRRLTPVELERLCGFPDNWTSPKNLRYTMPEARRAFFMGNALVVGLIEMVGRVIAEDLGS